MHELTQREATLLTHTLHEIRPDWTVNSLMTLMAANRNIPSFADLTLAAVTKARDTTCKTPAPIFLPGNHWPEAIRARLPDAPKCEDHDTYDAHACGPCASEIALGQRNPNDAGKKTTGQGVPPTPEYRELRNQIRDRENHSETTRGVAPF